MTPSGFFVATVAEANTENKADFELITAKTSFTLCNWQYLGAFHTVKTDRQMSGGRGASVYSLYCCRHVVMGGKLHWNVSYHQMCVPCKARVVQVLSVRRLQTYIAGKDS